MAPNNSPRFRISLVQLLASALAAITAAVAGSYLGVNGTVIGAAVASVLSVAGTALYGHSLQRTSERVRTVVPASARRLPDHTAPVVPPAAQAEPAAPTRQARPLFRIAVATGVVFVAALILLTGIELIAGRPVSDLVTGKTASGTTVFGSARAATTPTPAVTVTVVPKVVVTTPTVTQTAPAVTVTSTPSTTQGTPTPTSTPTPGASGTPTGTPGP